METQANFSADAAAISLATGAAVTVRADPIWDQCTGAISPEIGVGFTFGGKRAAKPFPASDYSIDAAIDWVSAELRA